MRKFVLVPDGEIEAPLLAAIAARLHALLGTRQAEAEATTGDPVVFPPTAPARAASPLQWSSAAILQALAARTTPGVVTLAVTEKDLCLPMLSFVFGHAQLGGRLAVLSLARLRQEFYGLPPDPALLQERAIKESLHEVGHALGLVHCTDPECAMSLSTGIEQVDAKAAAFCRTCRALVLELGDPAGPVAAPGKEVQP